MPLSRGQLALIHIARRDLRWSDDSYRTVLAEIAGVTSAAELDRAGFDRVMAFAAHCGFRPAKPKGESWGNRAGMATPGQLALIRALWREYTAGRAGEAELTKWTAAKWHVAHLRFLTADAARKAITALKAMKARERARATAG